MGQHEGQVDDVDQRQRQLGQTVEDDAAVRPQKVDDGFDPCADGEFDHRAVSS
jgi:hypothetical protein